MHNLYSLLRRNAQSIIEMSLQNWGYNSKDVSTLREKVKEIRTYGIVE